MLAQTCASHEELDEKVRMARPVPDRRTADPAAGVYLVKSAGIVGMAGSAPAPANVALLPVYAYLILLMTCFNFFSHGTQDLYPTFFKVQHGPEPHIISLMAICYSIAAMPRGVFFRVLSEDRGRKNVYRSHCCAGDIAVTGVLQRFPRHRYRRVYDAGA